MNKLHAIHFVGIKGVGMTPLAIIAQEAGVFVTGSDIDQTFITDKALQQKNISVFKGFSAEHIKSAELVITTGAHGGYNNVEVQEAKRRNIPVMSQAQAVGEYINGSVLGKRFSGISITGTHGKTTTTAMVATMLTDAKKDPGYLIGTSEAGVLEYPGHFGTGEYFVAEADEYVTEPQFDLTPKFLWQYPKIAVMTNLEMDHPDVYPNIEALQKAFSKFTFHIPGNGSLIVNGDDKNLQSVIKIYHRRPITFGLANHNMFMTNVTYIDSEQTLFTIEKLGKEVGKFMIRVPGIHNALNATASVIVGLEIGLTVSEIQSGLKAFHGSKRRLEYRGVSTAGLTLYDDYAHHPTEIRATLAALRASYPEYQIVCVFQPHTYSRTKKLFDQFANSFSEADQIILTDIFASAREAEDASVSSKQLAQAVEKLGKEVEYKPSLQSVVEYIQSQRYPKETIILTMGAGDVYSVLNNL